MWQGENELVWDPRTEEEPSSNVVFSPAPRRRRWLRHGVSSLQLSIRKQPRYPRLTLPWYKRSPLTTLGEPSNGSTNSGGHRKCSPSLLGLRFLSPPEGYRAEQPSREAPAQEVPRPGKPLCPHESVMCLPYPEDTWEARGYSQQHTVRGHLFIPRDQLSFLTKSH